ncbi:MAG: hypothetical protein II625_06635 [Bacilli bacterium]|nr:hypothetical protein [Bacilli bacterium]
MAIEREYLGFINLDKWHIKDKQVINVFNSFSFMCRKQKFFFKELKNSSQFYNELIGYELAKDYGMEAIPYDVASYDGFVGYLSRDYMKDGYVYLEDILKKQYGDSDHRNNLDDASYALREIYPEFAEQVIHDLIELLMFDIIIANYDRHDRNIIVDTANGRLAPVSDNEMMLSDDSMYGQYYSFKMNSNDHNTLDNLLHYLDLEGINYFLSKIEIINPKNIESVFSRVEAKIRYPMIEPIKKQIAKGFNDNYHILINHVKKELESRKLLSKK